jgi:hypothetical protein
MALHRLAALQQQPFPMAARLQALPAAGNLGRTLWLTGLSGAGKSTLARQLLPMLRRDGLAACLVDGDELRNGLSRDLGFSAADRAESVRRAAELAHLLNQQGVYAVVALISPLAAQRDMARRIVGEARLPGGACQDTPQRLRAARSQGLVCAGTAWRDCRVHGHLRGLRNPAGPGLGHRHPGPGHPGLLPPDPGAGAAAFVGARPAAVAYQGNLVNSAPVLT